MIENSEQVRLSITIPSGEDPLVDYGRHFNVQGSIRSDRSLPDDAVFIIRLSDDKGHVLRHVKQHKKDNHNLYLDHPDLTSYPEETDPGRRGIAEFGFPELLVRDIGAPMDSFRDATIKCWYSDTCFKAVIASGTGPEQGRIFDDKVGLTDENGNPYPMLLPGDYLIEAELRTSGGKKIACAQKSIRIGRRRSQAIVRFNPLEHKRNMTRWCKKMGIGIETDVIPGYLDAYKGIWLYHMGLLPMYRANDIEMYKDVPIHMFFYLIDPTSTSYETELAFLQSEGEVKDPSMFHAYHYDIGEAVVGQGKPYERHGKVVEFPSDEYLALCRVDVVNGKAKENVYDLSGKAVEQVIFDTDDVTVESGSTIAVTGVVKPWQSDPEDFRLRPDNTYEISDGVSELHYEISDGSEVKRETRKLLMERIDKDSIGTSVYEFYNLFTIDRKYKGKVLTIRVTACDKHGERQNASASLTLRVK